MPTIAENHPGNQLPTRASMPPPPSPSTQLGNSHGRELPRKSNMPPPKPKL